MTTVLQYLVIAAVIGLVVFALAVVVFGRGEQLAPLSPRISPTELPDQGMTADDVRGVRFAMALRGYRMSDVDWALERMADEVDRLRAKVAVLAGESPPAGTSGGSSSGERPGGDRESADQVPGADESDSHAPAGPILTGAGQSPLGRHLRSEADGNTTGDES